MDDFQEFYENRYHHVLLVLREAGLEVGVERASMGCYMLVVRNHAKDDTFVEVTSGSGPLPPDPVDVQVWTLTTENRKVLVPTVAGLEPFVSSLAQLLRTPSTQQ